MGSLFVALGEYSSSLRKSPSEESAVRSIFVALKSKGSEYGDERGRAFLPEAYVRFFRLGVVRVKMEVSGRGGGGGGGGGGGRLLM